MQIAAQAYTIRAAFDADPVAALARLRDIGYAYTELAGLYDHPASEVRRALTDAGVTALSMHLPFERLRDDYEGVVDEAATLGVDHLVVPWLDDRYRRDGLDGYRQVGSQLGELADRLADDGFALHYHNHDFELAAIDGSLPLVALAEAAGRSLGIQLDLGWIRVAGLDASDQLRHWDKRATLAHFKDVVMDRPDGERFRPLGQGEIDWNGVLAASASIGLAWAIVEDDDAQEPFDSLARSRRYLDALTVAG